ncbi:hypothetical protein [Streptomyces platensis]|uniref:hypothetical protein n=1 Tax=Streptomyces platensis TaxID=58346 RepID=UPI003326476C
MTWWFWALAVAALVSGAAKIFRKYSRQEPIGATDVLFPLMAAGVAAAAPTFMQWVLYGRRDSGDQPPAPEHHDAGPALPWGTILIALAAVVGVVIVVAGVAAGTSAVRRRRKRRRTQTERRRAVEARHDAAREEFGAFQSDILAVLDRPALADVTVPQTARLIHALAEADDARAADRSTEEGAAAYQRAVTELEIASQAAGEHARRVGLGTLAPGERKAIEQARKLLAGALSDGATEHERRLAYEHARRLLDDATSVCIPQQATAALEGAARAALTKKPRNER